MKLKKTIPADQLIGLSPDLEGMVQSIRGQQTVGKEKKTEKDNDEDEEEVGEGDTEEEEAAPKKKEKKTSTSKTSRKKATSKKAELEEEDLVIVEDFDDIDEEEKEKNTKRFKKSTQLSKRQVDIDEDDNEMDMFNKYVDYYAGQPGRGRAVWLEDELVESFSKLKDYDPKYSIRTVICAALRTFIAKNAKELGELKRPQKKGLF